MGAEYCLRAYFGFETLVLLYSLLFALLMWGNGNFCIIPQCKDFTVNAYITQNMREQHIFPGLCDISNGFDFNQPAKMERLKLTSELGNVQFKGQICIADNRGRETGQISTGKSA
ncbi:hypothetical protein C8J57DRAFT_1213075 [Mycena rebaudengoi]|nr:hypothetical protein C8J57DRAFT_1213075 [Mycena rebaudengoi]